MKRYLILRNDNSIFGLLIIYSLIIPFSRFFINNTTENLFLSFLADVFIIILFLILMSNSSNNKIHLIDILLAIFVFFNILSGLNIILLNMDYPQLYFYGLHMTVLPMILYFGARFTNFESSRILYIIWQIGLIHIGIGIISYSPIIRYLPSIIRPILYQLNNLCTYRIEENWGLLVRMRSCLDSLTFGNIAGITFLLSFYFILTKKKKYYYFILILSLLAVALSYQRSSWIAILVGLFILVLFIQSHNKGKKVFLLIGIILIIIVIINNILPENYKNYLNSRFTDLISGGRSAISGRVNQWYYGMEVIANNPFGVGIGELGHKAARFAKGGVYDGNYFKIFAEIGLIGFLFFLLIILDIIKRFILILNSKQHVYNNGEKILMFVILIFYMIQAIGTNVWDLYYSNIIFWLILGLYHNDYNTT